MQNKEMAVTAIEQVKAPETARMTGQTSPIVTPLSTVCESEWLVLA